MMIPCLKSEAIASETTPFNKLSRGGPTVYLDTVSRSTLSVSMEVLSNAGDPYDFE